MPAEGGSRVGWGAALALFLAVLLVSALDALPLLTIPLALVLLAIPFPPRWRGWLAGAALGLVGISSGAGPLGSLSRAWALLLGGGFVAATLWRPGWGVLQRALLAVASAMALVVAWLGATGAWPGLDERVRQHLTSVSDNAVRQFQEMAAGSPWLEGIAAAAEQTVEFQWTVFPALVGLQSLAALALASWLMTRLRGADQDAFSLARLREFRFSDQLVWVVIVGLLLVLLPTGALATRLGWNALFFMGALYALRGLGIAVFLSAGMSRLYLMVVAVLAVLLIYPLVVVTVLMLGLVDTWLDLRARAAAPPQTPA
jgi:hypothetical protein